MPINPVQLAHHVCDDCRQDAVALLGGEEAVREYVEGKSAKAEEGPKHDGPTDLFGQPMPPKQGRMFD